MAIVWTPDLATNIEEIDRQHQELFQRINNLLDACNQGKGKAEVTNVIRFLEDYVISHFAEEERYMQQYAYPAAGDHKAEHKEFKKNFSQLKEQFQTDGPGVHIVIRANHIIVEWLRSHILKVDKALGEFLRTKRSPRLS